MTTCCACKSIQLKHIALAGKDAQSARKELITHAKTKKTAKITNSKFLRGYLTQELLMLNCFIVVDSLKLNEHTISVVSKSA